MSHTGLDHVRHHWDEVAANKNENAVAYVPQGRTFDETGVDAAARFFASVPAGALRTSVLEIGCGLGRVTKRLFEQFDTVVAADIAPRMCAHVSAHVPVPAGKRLATIVTDGTDLEKKLAEAGVTTPIDVVYSDSVFLHNLKVDVRRIARSVSRILSVGGHFVFQLPCYQFSGKDPEHWTDVGVWTRSEIEEMAQLAGLEVISIAENPGAFSFSAIGPRHADFHILKRTS